MVESFFCWNKEKRKRKSCFLIPTISSTRPVLPVPTFFWIIIRRDDDVDDVNRCQIFLPLFCPSRWGRKWRRRKKKKPITWASSGRAPHSGGCWTTWKLVQVGRCLCIFRFAGWCRTSPIKNQRGNNKKNGRKSFNIQRPIFPNQFRYILQFRPTNFKIKINFTL